MNSLLLILCLSCGIDCQEKIGPINVQIVIDNSVYFNQLYKSKQMIMDFFNEKFYVGKTASFTVQCTGKNDTWPIKGEIVENPANLQKQLFNCFYAANGQSSVQKPYSLPFVLNFALKYNFERAEIQRIILVFNEGILVDDEIDAISNENSQIYKTQTKKFLDESRNGKIEIFVFVFSKSTATITCLSELNPTKDTVLVVDGNFDTVTKTLTKLLCQKASILPGCRFGPDKLGQLVCGKFRVQFLPQNANCDLTSVAELCMRSFCCDEIPWINVTGGACSATCGEGTTVVKNRTVPIGSFCTTTDVTKCFTLCSTPSYNATDNYQMLPTTTSNPLSLILIVVASCGGTILILLIVMIICLCFMKKMLNSVGRKSKESKKSAEKGADLQKPDKTEKIVKRPNSKSSSAKSKKDDIKRKDSLSNLKKARENQGEGYILMQKPASTKGSERESKSEKRKDFVGQQKIGKVQEKTNYVKL